MILIRFNFVLKTYLCICLFFFKHCFYLSKSISKSALYFHKYRAKPKKSAPTHSSSGSVFPYIATVIFYFWRITVHSLSNFLLFSNRLYKPFLLLFILFLRFFSLSSPPFSPLCSLSFLRSLPLFSIASSPLSFVDFLVVVGLIFWWWLGWQWAWVDGGLGFVRGFRFRFVRGFRFWSRRRSGLRFAVGGFAVLYGLPWLGWAWVCRDWAGRGFAMGMGCRGSWESTMKKIEMRREKRKMKREKKS